MSKTKQGGSTRLGRDSAAQRLGIKAYAGEKINIGQIIIRQRGTQYLPGKNVRLGSDDTIYAMKDGVVKFSSKTKKLFNGTTRDAKVVSVVEGTKAEPKKAKAPKVVKAAK
jgi:large subunit ribosomal protein L27